MGASFTSQSVERVRAQKRKSRWYKIIACLAAVVVFCTTYALILPAITKEQPVYCGYIDQHTDECYEEVRTLTCTIPEGGHVHTDKCYETKKALSCTLTEGEGHTHSDACYETIQTLVCTDPEHAHDESCYTESRVLICGQEEAAPHHHSDSCYTEEKTLACGFEEASAHTHTDECYTIEKKLICDHKVHEHTLQCYSDPEADVETRETWERTVERVELTDDWNADVLAIAKTQLGYHESERNYEVQANGVSMKGYTRYGAWYGIPYGDWCAMFCSFCLNYAEVDPKLMPRDANCPHWIRTLSSEDFDLYHPAYKFVERLEEKGIEQLKADAEEAEKQEADEEVVENEEVPEQTDEEVPEDEEDDEETTEDEEEKEDTYIPRPGDLIFFDWNSYKRQSDRESDHIGFVAELIYEEVPNEDEKPDEDGKKTHEELTKIRTIEGNSANQVRYVTYDINDDRILGYGELPEKPEEDEEEEELLNVPSILSSWLGGSMRLMAANGPAANCVPSTTTINFANANNDGGKYSVINPSNSYISNGFVTTTTKDAFEPAGDQLNGTSATTPKDAVSVPVSGDWTATLKFDFSKGSAQNGYYQFFGFYAAAGNDYNNLIGIRGGDGAMQDFVRKNGGRPTADTDGVKYDAIKLSQNGTYWYRIVKSGTTYTCYVSTDGTNFNRMFQNASNYSNTGIDASRLLIDAYTGMTEGYQFTLKTLDITSTGGEHSYQTVSSTPATCTSAGSATYRCSKCNDQYTETIPALGHNYGPDGVCTLCSDVTTSCERTSTINFGNANNDGGKFEIKGQRTAAISNGGLVITSTRDAIEPCNNQNSGSQANTASDLISVPIGSGDWTATLKFDANPTQNGAYEFFGFFASEGDDYQNMAGIRGGDGAMQDFLRKSGTVTAETKNYTAKTLTTNTDYFWYKIEKTGTTYTCYVSTDGSTFTRMFQHSNTGIDADRLIIDAYSGQATGYSYNLKTLDITSNSGHQYEVVDTATCTQGGTKIYTCSICGDTYEEESDPLGHDYDADGVCVRCGERTDNKQPYYLHPISKVSDLIGKTFVVACLNDDYPKSPGALNDDSYGTNATGGDGAGVGRSTIQIPALSTNTGTIYGYDLTQWTFTDGGNGSTVKLQSLDGRNYLVLDSNGVRVTTAASEATAFNVTIKNDGSFRLQSGGLYLSSSGHAPNYNFFIKSRQGDDLWAFGIEPYVPPAPEETRSSASGIFAKHNVYSVDDMIGVYAIANTPVNYKTSCAMLATTLNDGGLDSAIVGVDKTAANDAPMIRADSPITLWKIERVDAKHVRLKANGENGMYIRMNGNSFTFVNNASEATPFLVDIMNNGSAMLRVDNGGYVNAKNYDGDEGYFLYQSGDALTLYTPTNIQSNTNAPIVWLDGTNGDLMNFFGSPDVNYSDHLTDNHDGTYSFVLPLTWTSPTKYDYRLFGWYDTSNHKYYAPGETVTLRNGTDRMNTVFYADWRAASYDVGEYNEHVLPDVTTENFVRTQVFDYGVLFNTLSEAITDQSHISALGHREHWNRINSGINPATGQNTLDFQFIDYNMEGYMLDKPGRPNIVEEDANNTSHYTAVQQGILGISNYGKFDQQRKYMVNGQNRTLLDMLFNPDSDFDPDSQQGVIGVSYIGEGDQFYHYMELGDPNYDGVHDGYYYYDSKLNAASYNQSEQRFFVYDYLETTDSPNHFSDFLPFNSLYANNNGRRVNQVDTKNGMPVYSYDATDYHTPRGQEQATDHAIANYFFGLRTDISFYLPNQSGYTEQVDGKTVRGNQSTRGKDMEFYFSGDDDVWVFVDDELILDIGGMHGVLTGRINFSTGAWAVYNKNDNDQEVLATSGTKIFQPGEHVLTIYYMERGSSQSNCAIYYNLAPRYGFEMKKQDGFTGENLNGVEFEVYEDEQLSVPAELWPDEATYRGYIAQANGQETLAHQNATNRMTVTNGVAACWGLAAGKTYYLKEVATPSGFKAPKDVIRIRLNAYGKAIFETQIIDNGDNETDISAPAFDVDDYTKSIDLTAYNQQDDSFPFTVKKRWMKEDGHGGYVEESAAEAATHPPITVELQYKLPGQDDGTSFENFGITVPLGVLSSENNWTYTWYGIPKVLHAKKTPWGGSSDIALEGNLWAKETPIAIGYTVEEEPNEPTVVTTYRWAKVSQVTNGKTYILYNEDIQQALKPIGDYTFSGLSLNDAKEDASAQWVAGYDSSTGKFTLKNASPPTAGRGYLNLWPDQSCAFVWSTAYQSSSYGAYFQYENGKLYSDDTATYLGQFRPNHTNYNLGLASNSSDAANIALYEYQAVQETIPPADNSYDFKLANYPIPDEDYTRIEVTKLWVDENGNEMNPFECDLPPVTIRLTSRFLTADTARKIVLSKENGYRGSFEKLPDLGSSDDYSLVEETDLGNYVVEGTSSVDGELVQGITIDVEEWEILNSGGGVNASSLAPNGIYRFHNGNEALSAEPGTTRVFMARTDDNDLFQRWKVTAIQGSQIKLQNLGTLMYLSYGKEGAWTCTTSTSSDKWINLNGGKLNWNVADGTHVGLDNNQSGKVFPQVYDDCSVYKISHLTTRQVSGLSKQSFTVTNKRLPSIEISVFKKWSDGYAAHTNDSVTVHLLWKDRGASDDTYVDTGKSLTLSRENGWTGTFTDLLEYTQDFYGAAVHYKDYKVVEDDFPGYAPSFQITTDDTTGDQDVVITNGPPGYELPESGGAGTTIFYALGGAMMLLAIMCGFSMRRKRERGSTR